MAKTIIHVNSLTIRSNEKHDKNEPPLTVRRGKSGKPSYAHELELLDRNGKLLGKVVYSRKRPLACGARVYLELESDVYVGEHNENEPFKLEELSDAEQLDCGSVQGGCDRAASECRQAGSVEGERLADHLTEGSMES